MQDLLQICLQKDHMHAWRNLGERDQDHQPPSIKGCQHFPSLRAATRSWSPSLILYSSDHGLLAATSIQSADGLAH